MLACINRIVPAIVLMIAFAAPPAMAGPNSYGALAYSPSRGIDGYAFNFRTKSAAQSVALRNCRARASGCRIVASFRGGCAALAVGRKSGWGASRGNRRAEARSRAMSTCRQYGSGCRIQRTVCT
jgi:serine/threonine-protein kinase